MHKDIKILKSVIREKLSYRIVVITRNLLLISAFIAPFLFNAFGFKPIVSIVYIPLSLIALLVVHLINIKIHNQFAPVSNKTMQFLNDNLSERTKYCIFGEKNISSVVISKIDLFVITNTLIDDVCR